MAEELWQEYNEQGEPIGAGLTKREAAAGALHGASHVWFWRGHGDSLEILLQKRADGIPTWPNLYDVSAAGHFDFGEPPLEAAIRETEEEIAHTISAENLCLLFVFRQYLVAADDIIENEFQWVYGYEVKETLEEFSHDGEVEAAEWVTMATFEAMIAGKANKQIVPHGEAYFSLLKRGIALCQEQSRP